MCSVSAKPDLPGHLFSSNAVSRGLSTMMPSASVPVAGNLMPHAALESARAYPAQPC
jgi:hypothetical protein